MDQIMKMSKWNNQLNRDKKLNVFYKLLKHRLDVGIVRMSDINTERDEMGSIETLSRDYQSRELNVYKNDILNKSFKHASSYEECMEMLSTNHVEENEEVLANNIFKDSLNTTNSEIDKSGGNYESKIIDVNDKDMEKIHNYISKIKSFMALNDSPKLVTARIVSTPDLIKTPLLLEKKHAKNDEKMQGSTNVTLCTDASNNETTPNTQSKLIRVKITVPKNTFSYKDKKIPRIVSAIVKAKMNMTYPNEKVEYKQYDNNTKEAELKQSTIAKKSPPPKKSPRSAILKRNGNNTINSENSFTKVSPNIAHSSVDELASDKKRALSKSCFRELSPIANLSLPYNPPDCQDVSYDSEIIKELVLSRFESSLNKSARQRKSHTHLEPLKNDETCETPNTNSNIKSKYLSCLESASKSTTASVNIAPVTIVTNAQVECVDSDTENTKYFTPISNASTRIEENTLPITLKSNLNEVKVPKKVEPIYTPVKKVVKKNICIPKPTPKTFSLDTADLDKISVCKPIDGILNNTFTKCEKDHETSGEDTAFHTLDDRASSLGSCSDTSFSSFIDGRSIRTMDASVLISQNGSYYYRPRGSTYTKHKGGWSSGMISIPTYETVNFTEETDKTVTEENEIVKKLRAKADIQEDIMRQASNAIYMYKHSNTKVSTATQIEAEKVLLLALLRRKAIYQEIPKIGYEEVRDNYSLNLGTVYITDVTFPLKPEVAEKNRTLNQKEWLFICTVTCGERVYCSTIVPGNDLNEIKIKESFVFDGVTPDFEVQLNLYAMKIPKERKKKRRMLSTKCFRKIERALNKLSDLVHGGRWQTASFTRKNTNYPQMTSFLKWGHVHLRFCDLSRNFNWKLNRVPSYATLTGYVNMNISSAVNICNKQSGFLNVAIETLNGCKEWNRRWCVLDGPILSFWNYPHDEEESVALKTLDLRYCISNGVTHADREMCARPRTLLLETAAHPEAERRSAAPVDENNHRWSKGSVIVRHFLSADTVVEMQAWEWELNSVICSLRDWNAAKCKLICPKSQ